MFTKPSDANVDPPNPLADIDRQKTIFNYVCQNCVASQIARIKVAAMYTIIY